MYKDLWNWLWGYFAKIQQQQQKLKICSNILRGFILIGRIPIEDIE